MKRIAISLLFSLLFIYTSAFAQQVQYKWAEHGAQAGDFARTVKVISGQDNLTYVLISYTEPIQFGSHTINTAANENAAVICFDQTGSVKWNATMSNSDGMDLTDMIIDKQGNLIVGGWFINQVNLGSALSLSFDNADTQKIRHEFFIAKLNPSGQWNWARKQSGNSYSEISVLGADAHGNVFAGGFFMGEAFTIAQESLQPEEELPFVIKYDSLGQPEWLRGADTPFGADLSGMTVLDNGSVCITGTYGVFEIDQIGISFGNISLTNIGVEDDDYSLTTGNTYIALLNESGNYLWAKQAGSLNYETFSGNLATDNARIYLSGMFQDNISFEGSTFSETALGEEGDMDCYIACIDLNGNWLWVNTIASSEDDEMPYLTSSYDERIYVFGNLNDTNYTLGSIELTPQGQNSSFLGRIMPDGNWKWAFTHPDIVDVSVIRENQFAFTGLFSGTLSLDTFSLIASANSPDIYVAVAQYSDKEPDMIHFLSENTENELVVYPNPFLNSFKLGVSEPGTWDLFGADGRKVGSGLIKAKGEHNLYFDSLPMGVYFLKFHGQSGRTYQKKMIGLN